MAIPQALSSAREVSFRWGGARPQHHDVTALFVDKAQLIVKLQPASSGSDIVILAYQLLLAVQGSVFLSDG
ncbi:MAG: hypothetical protein LPD71_11310 [Shewanella sp.]|nr:hypothetical protein [Shewanella sp.]MCF1458328.1 hypothetical protein [Shewanella sp.]